MNAPKKIWVDVLERDIATWEWEGGTPYIREDVVLELVEALEGMLDWFGYPEDHECSRSDKARAALAKLEENEDEISPELREGMRKWAEARAINGLKELWRKKDD